MGQHVFTVKLTESEMAYIITSLSASSGHVAEAVRRAEARGAKDERGVEDVQRFESVIAKLRAAK